jgi:hypothetical protein
MSGSAVRLTEKHTLHFDLAHIEPHDEFTLHACLKRFPLKRHTGESLERARATHPFLQLVPSDNITHYIEDIDLPSDAVTLLYVTNPVQINGDTADHTVLMSIHIPNQGRKLINTATRQLPAESKPWQVHPKLACFGWTEPGSDHRVAVPGRFPVPGPHQRFPGRHRHRGGVAVSPSEPHQSQYGPRRPDSSLHR